MAPDPYRYFRLEARDLLDQLAKGVLEIEKGGSTTAIVQRLLRLAHTLKGAARVVKQHGIADGAHAIEDRLAPLRDAAGIMAREEIEAVLRQLDTIGAGLRALDAPDEKRPAAVEEPSPTVRAELAEMDALLDGVAEAHAQLSALRAATAALEPAQHLTDLLEAGLGSRHPGGRDGLVALAAELKRHLGSLDRHLGFAGEQLDRELRQLRDTAEQLRLVPIGSVFTALERTARDTAGQQAKSVALEAAGGDIRLDAHVVSVIQGALVQIVRNAVAHGIGTPADRLRTGKPAAGRIAIAVRRRGRRIVFDCRDDGRGIDLEAVRRLAAQRGLLAAGAPPSGPEELIGLLLRGGLTTAKSVSAAAGRGIGLDIVRAALERLRGDVRVRTEAGRGTSFELTVPPSLAAMQALLVEAAGATVAIPLDAVTASVRLTATSGADGATIVHGGEAVPFVPLAAALAPARAEPGRTWTAVVVSGRAGRAAVGVDRLVGTARVVVRPLPDTVEARDVVAGAWLDADGTPRLVLDPDGLVALALRRDAAAPAPAAAGLPVLIIDDSLTTRMLEQTILESAGYRVALASSAEEGLERARDTRYGLFLVDVEMPGMDGFAFVERVRADPALHVIPAILVTSRAAPEDLQRGRSVGAQGYIVKSQFDQVEFLAMIGRLKQ